MNCLWRKFNLSAPYSFRTLFACLKSYVKTIEKKTWNKTRLVTAYNRFDEHQSYFEYRRKYSMSNEYEMFLRLTYLFISK